MRRFPRSASYVPLVILCSALPASAQPDPGHDDQPWFAPDGASILPAQMIRDRVAPSSPIAFVAEAP